ncbi:MAG: twin-arginine translocase subunit TatC [Bdellovibrio sp.]
MPAQDKAPESQSFVEHLEEFRIRLIRSAWAIALVSVVAYNFSEQIFAWLRRPIQSFLPSGGLVFTAPMDKFVAHLKISFFLGIAVSAPFWLYQVWGFVAPALYKSEKKYAAWFIVSGSFLFIAGILFCYFLVFPLAFEFLMTYGGSVDQPMITIDQYLSFVITTAFLFGLAFELPLILVILGLVGLVSADFLRRNRRFAIVFLSIFAAVLTPPDVISMVSMLIPLAGLYEIAILLVGAMEKRSPQAGDQFEDQGSSGPTTDST